MVKNGQSKSGANRRNNKPKSRRSGRARQATGASSSNAGKMAFAPASITRGMTSSRPIMRVDRDGHRIVFREYVQDIAGSVAFSATSYPINPGISTLFAWLSEQASLYNEYEFDSLRFAYETEKSSATNGKVMFAFQTDAADAVPASKQEMLENEFKAGNACWEPFVLAVPTKSESLGGRRFIRTGTLASNLDIKTYDLGNLIVGVQGMADTTAVGELYVEYSLRLRVPILNALARTTTTSLSLTGVTPSTASLFGTTPTSSGGLNVTATGNVLTFNRVGRYLIDCTVTGTGLFTSFVPTYTDGTGLSSAGAPAGLSISNAAANAGTAAMFNRLVIVTVRGATLTINCAAIATTLTGSVTLLSPFNVAST